MRYLSNYKSFKSKDELNKATAAHFKRCKYEMNKTDNDVLLMISRHAIKYPGAAHLKNNTIATALEKSVRTIQRSIRKLEQLEILEKQSFLRKVKGGFGANILVIINPSVTSDLSCREQAGNPYTPTVKPVKIEKEALIFKTQEQEQSLHDTFPQEPTLYQRFQSILENSIGNKKTARRFFGVYRAHSVRQLRFSHNAKNKDLFQELGVQALHITVQATKKKNIGNPVGYYDGVFRGLLDKALFSVDPFKLCTH